MRKKSDDYNSSSSIKSNSIDTLIGEGTTIEGNIKIKGNIIIYGKIQGNVEASGSINVSPGAEVEGQLSANVLQLGGKIKGDVKSTGKIVLGEKSYLTGDISTPNLIIKEGAKFEGRCDMGKTKSPIKI